MIIKGLLVALKKAVVAVKVHLGAPRGLGGGS